MSANVTDSYLEHTTSMLGWSTGVGKVPSLAVSAGVPALP